MEVEILRRVLPAAVENVGVNGYVSDYGIHQPNVTNLRKFFFYIKKILGKILERARARVCSFGSNSKKNIEWKKNKKKISVRFLIIEKLKGNIAK